ncbi:uncharacterized protein FA14DRAFT_20671 [Meira miltonrushii]|uniref:RanBD1 domain-containing protein n=1 Tax=Meira miltonrushii TaxID=1280837 RepID=A0A316VLG1_9BASI|nr:uncharacterized protein FA14DRAFT_20671 [Meira miltonrushii]PWN37908.1 hypothetical protein FA14DRAFT_20671 [Meira miltonrushii]
MTQDSTSKNKSNDVDSKSIEDVSIDTSTNPESDTLNKSTSISHDDKMLESADKLDEAHEDIADLPAKRKSTELDMDHAESLRRKRDREGSLEPTLTPSQKEIPAKKNRLQDDTSANDPPGSAPSSPSRKSNIEGEKVGQIRKRVEDLSWKQRKEGNRDGGDDDEGDVVTNHKEELKRKTSADNDDEQESSIKDDADHAEPQAKKSSQPTFSSFSSSSGFGSAKKDASSSIFDQDAKAATEKAPKSPPPLPARTQPTFSSFSKSGSPFNSATASIAGPSWLAGKSTASGGLKPSSLGAVPGSSSAGSDKPSVPLGNTSSSSTSPPPSNAASSKGLGFGAFASANPFSPKGSGRMASPALGSDKKSSEANDASQADNVKESEKGTEEENGRSFDEALKEKGEKEEGKQKVETQLDKGQADLRTGEEDEFAVASVRAKLFTMAEDQSWKERGTGTVRCNVPKVEGGGMGGARLVMRSEGVLRLILNIKLFKGIKVNLEQDKFLRIVAFEDGKPAHFALRIGNASAASQFYYTIRDHIPTTDNEAKTVAEVA